MDKCVLILVACLVLSCSCWSVAHHPARAPLRVLRYAIPPHQHQHPPGPRPRPQHQIPVRVVRAPPPVNESPDKEPQPQWQRPKRGHDSHDYDGHGSSGVTGPVHTFVKTDKNANYKWGVRHHVGDKFSS